MPRPPSVDPELVRQVMSQRPRPTSAQAAEIIAEMLGKPVAASNIRVIISRRGQDWDLAAPETGGKEPVMEYRCARDLGPVRGVHRTTRDWIMLTAYERVQAGLLDAQSAFAIAAVGYVVKRLALGLVTDYHPSGGFFTRVALPWEVESRSYYRSPAPEYARLEMEIALREHPPGEVRESWIKWLEMDRAAMGSLVRGDR